VSREVLSHQSLADKACLDDHLKTFSHSNLSDAQLLKSPRTTHKSEVRQVSAAEWEGKQIELKAELALVMRALYVSVAA